MNFTEVKLDIIFSGRPIPTDGTFERFVACMNSFVLVQSLYTCEAFLTKFTLKLALV